MTINYERTSLACSHGGVSLPDVPSRSRTERPRRAWPAWGRPWRTGRWRERRGSGRTPCCSRPRAWPPSGWTPGRQSRRNPEEKPWNGEGTWWDVSPVQRTWFCPVGQLLFLSFIIFLSFFLLYYSLQTLGPISFLNVSPRDTIPMFRLAWNRALLFRCKKYLILFNRDGPIRSSVSVQCVRSPAFSCEPRKPAPRRWWILPPRFYTGNLR